MAKKFKNITIKKKGGGTRKQRVHVLASGKYKFVKNKPKKGSSPRKTSKTRSSGKGRSMAKKKRRGKRKFTIPLAPTFAIVGQIARPAPSGRTLIGDLMSGDMYAAIYDAREIFAGIDNTGAFRPEWLLSTYGPIAAAMLVHKFVGGAPLNLNRMLAQAGVPVIRI